MGGELVRFVGGKREDLKIDLVLHWCMVVRMAVMWDVFLVLVSSNILNDMQVERE